MKNKFIRIWSLVLFISLSAGCSTVKINFRLNNPKDINTFDEFGDSILTSIRIYQLKEYNRFNKAHPKALFKEAGNLLKDDILEVQKARIYSNQNTKVKVKKLKETKYIGLVAMLKTKEGNHIWKNIFKANDKRLKDVFINLKKDKNTIKLNLIPSNEMNSVNGDPFPTSIKIYLLKSKDLFMEANFKSLWKKDKETLGEEALVTKYVNVYPENNVTVDIKKILDANYVGVAAIFRKPGSDKSWKRIVDLKENYIDNFDVIINKDNIEMIERKNRFFSSNY